jgi:monovalent cation/hydrogen antiporter
VTEPVLLVLGLAVTIACAIVAKRLALPYPIVFVLAGTLFAFVPGVPPVRIDPNWIFISILPPLLFFGGWQTDWTLFRARLRPILQLAIGLVIVSTLAVAALAERIVPGLGWASAFVLGAIVSPPDAVAAMATFERFAVPRSVAAIIEGEGLVNDATALVIYGYAVAAAVTGAFSLPAATLSFVLVAVGGIAGGIVVAWIAEWLTRALARYELDDSLIDNLTLLGTPYAAYLGAQSIHVSGVLATVTAGILISRRSSVLYSPESRLIGVNVWELWIYVINAYVFLVIGLQLRTIVRDHPQSLALLPAALAISLLLIVVRLAWVFAASWAARRFPAVRREPRPPPSYLLVVGWSGMRGIISLAAALALPFRDGQGQPFPGRDAITFITFVVIFVTLVGQGLSLLPLLRWLKLSGDGDGEEREIQVRTAALEAGLKKIAELERKHREPYEREVLQRLRNEYETRIEHLRHHGPGEGGTERPESQFDHFAQTAAIHAERGAIMRLRDQGKIPDEIFRIVEYDMDLAEARLF